jgi:hypothetical protein
VETDCSQIVRIFKEILVAVANLFLGCWTAIYITHYGICATSATIIGMAFCVLFAFVVPFLSVGMFKASIFSTAICYSLPIFLFSFAAFPNHPYLSLLLVGGGFTVTSYTGARVAVGRTATASSSGISRRKLTPAGRSRS